MPSQMRNGLRSATGFTQALGGWLHYYNAFLHLHRFLSVHLMRREPLVPNLCSKKLSAPKPVTR
jgi:hypothetical protein